jgi:hypothetical protein
MLCLNNYTLHNDACKGEASLGIILCCFIHVCDDMPDDCRTVETRSTILRRRVSEINTQLCVRLLSSDVTGEEGVETDVMKLYLVTQK